MSRIRFVSRSVLVALLAVTSLSPVGPLGAQAGVPSLPSSNDSADVAAAVGSFHAALAAGDSASAMALLAADAVILESGGAESREEYRSHHLPGDIAFARTAKTVRGPLTVTVRGDVAWASSTSKTTREARAGTVNSTGAELVVLTRTAAGWRISAIHWSSRTVRPATG